jgi:hypothetical protein
VKLTPVITRLAVEGIVPSEALLRRLADSAGATAIRDALRQAERSGVPHNHSVMVRLRDRARLLGASGAQGQREARETIADRTEAVRRGHGMRLGPTCGNPRAVPCEDPRNPLALSSAGAVSRDLMPTSESKIRAAMAQAKADRALSRLLGDTPRAKRRGGRRRNKRTSAPRRNDPQGR